VTRKRRYIPLSEKLAAALSMLLPQDTRDDLRRAKAPSWGIVRLFQFDHNILHAHGGSDRWWNLTPMLKPLHREKSKRDNTIAAKVKRIRRGKKKPRRALRSRGFDKTRTLHFDGTVTPRNR